MNAFLSARSTNEAIPLIVWGGGTGALAAAVQAARLGVRTLLLTPGPWLGGMVSAAGVSAPDGHELSCWQTGLWGAFLREMAVVEPSGLDQNWVSCFGFHPSRAEQVLQGWVNDLPDLEWWSLVELKSLSRKADRLVSIEVEREGRCHQLHFNLLIDGSDLGDTLPFGEISHCWGWEAKETWNEPSAPSALRLENDPFFARQPVQSPTWVVMGQLDESRQPPAANSSLPHPFKQATERFGFERTVTYGRLPGGLVMLNWPHNGNDWHHGLEGVCSTEVEIRNELAEAMQSHSLAFLDALQNNSNGWLKPGNVFPGSNPSLALMPYWREGRRLSGMKTVSETDLLPLTSGKSRGLLPLDKQGTCTSIAVGSYTNDHHYPGEDWPLAAKNCQWGGRWTGTPFCIPYGALLSSEVENLLMADKAFSVSHMANGATRLQPMIFNLGQAAGVAAALALGNNIAPADLNVADIQQTLLRDPLAPAAVVPIWDWPIWHPSWRSAQEAVLKDPDCLSQHGTIEFSNIQAQIGALPKADQAPINIHAREFRGSLRIQPDATYSLETSNESLPVITLEPAVNSWLESCHDHQNVCLLAVLNHWGPWLRVIRALA
ncbi:MAG: FAD-dependent oxidoreductase [Prochlorococcus sp.]